MNLDAAKETFLQEARELLEEMESALLALEQTPDDADLVNAVFRAAHTIKGSSGLFGYDPVAAFTHRVESLLDQVRTGRRAFDDQLSALLLGCRDHIGELVETCAAQRQPDDALVARDRDLGERLERLAGTAPAPPAAAAEPAPRPSAGAGAWHISLRFGRDTLKNGLDPLALLRYLAHLGELASVQWVDDALPPLQRLTADDCFYALELELRTTADERQIREAFEFFEDDAEIRLVAPDAGIDEYLKLIAALPEEDRRIGEILVAGGVLSQAELDAVLAHQTLARAGDGAAAPRLGELLVEQGQVPRPVVEAAANKQQRAREAGTRRSVRVDADKLDRLINLVGELVIANSTGTLLARQLADEALLESNSVTTRLVEEIRDSALRLRMVPIAETFNRFQRVVRDVSRELGKDISLQLSGGDTELDKTLVEKIGDPLLHLVRNAMDHGIEPAAERRAAGKPERGSVTLSACHDSGSIVIEVSDDGRGLDAARILAKARERGLVAAEQPLSPAEAQHLIFEPGFSTAETVTDLSGRGVGMDVVKKNIEALRGSVEVESTPGAGTTFRIRLPLTLAIIDGFLVGVGESAYVVPLDMVTECIEVSRAERRAAEVDERYIDLRGEVLPYLRLHDLFEEPDAGGDSEHIVVVEFAGRRAGLVVDDLLGELQTVIKPLGRLFRHLRGVSGATILGSGEVAVILDVPQLVSAAAA